MTPQTPQGAALSDADIENFYSEALDADCAEVNIYKFARLCVAADRRLTAEQPVGKFWCESCDGTGKIDERLTAYSDSNPAAECPDCDGNGWWQSAPVTAEQGGAEPPKPFCHVVNMLEGLPENPSYIMLFDGQRLGNGFTHTALYTGEQLVAALTTQPQAEPAAKVYATDDMRRAAEMEFAYSGRHIGPDEAAALATPTPTAPTEPT